MVEVTPTHINLGDELSLDHNMELGPVTKIEHCRTAARCLDKLKCSKLIISTNEHMTGWCGILPPNRRWFIKQNNVINKVTEI